MLRLQTIVLLLFFAGNLLVGCEGTAPKRLSPATKIENLRLATDIHWLSSSSSSEFREEFNIAAGIYRPVGRDSSGIYFLGPPYFLTIRTTLYKGTPRSDFPTTRVNGGIYLPDNPKQAKKMFTIMGSGQKSHGSEWIPLNSNGPAVDASQLATNQISNGARPIQAGVGTAIGVGIAMQLAQASDGNYRIPSIQPSGAAIEASLRGMQDAQNEQSNSQPSSIVHPDSDTQKKSIALASKVLANAPDMSVDLREHRDTTPPQKVASDWATSAEEFAKSKGCAIRPVASLSSRGEGVETYKLLCADAHVMQVACKSNGCEAGR